MVIFFKMLAITLHYCYCKLETISINWAVCDAWSNFFQFSEERMSYYLYVDSLKPIELLVGFSALVRWGEPGGKRVEKMKVLMPRQCQARKHALRCLNYGTSSPLELLQACRDIRETTSVTPHQDWGLCPCLPLTLSIAIICSSLYTYTCHHSWFFQNLLNTL